MCCPAASWGRCRQSTTQKSERPLSGKASNVKNGQEGREAADCLRLPFVVNDRLRRFSGQRDWALDGGLSEFDPRWSRDFLAGDLESPKRINPMPPAPFTPPTLNATRAKTAFAWRWRRRPPGDGRRRGVWSSHRSVARREWSCVLGGRASLCRGAHRRSSLQCPCA